MERSQVQENYKWAVNDIFAIDEDWEKCFEETANSIDFTGFVGKLSDKNMLLALYKKRDEVSLNLEKLAVYAHMNRDVDSRVAKYSNYYAKCIMLFSKMGQELAFFDAEMATLDVEYLKSLINDSNFTDYDYQLKLVLKNRPHVISEKEERIMSLATETLQTFQDTFSMINNVDIKFPKMEYNGEEVTVTHGMYGVLLDSKDREKREEAYKKYYSVFLDNLNTIASNYSGKVKSNVFTSKVYKFNSSMEMALSYEDVDAKVYNNLLKSVKLSFPTMHRYINDRKKILGYDKLYFYDIYTSLVGNVDVKMSYDDAYNYVIKGLACLGKEYQELLKRAYDERWIDVEETNGKRSGAYSTCCNGVHPYVLLNYQPTTHNLFTIAHEMGHSLHSYFSNKNQPVAKADYKIFVAEVASTVNEVLLLKFMLNETDDVDMKKYLLNYFLEQIRTTLHRQTLFSEFEYQAHSLVEGGEAITKDALNTIYGNLLTSYYGDGIELDEQIIAEWARIPHFYNSFYVYKYSTGIISAINIANRIINEGQSAIDDYFKFLSSGSSTDPVSLLKYAGVDLMSEEPFEFAMQEFEKTLNEFEKLMGI